MTWFDPPDKVWVVAHRGASAYAPENTLAAFRKAVELGADAVEFDVHLTADGIPVVIHDQTLQRTTGNPARIDQTRLADIQALDAGSHFAKRFAGERIPTLDQVLEEIGRHLLLDIELKDLSNPFSDVPASTAAAVQKHNLVKKVLFCSFNPFFLIKVKKILPEALVGLLIPRGWADPWSKLWGSAWTEWKVLIPHFSDVDSKLISRQKTRGRRVLAYTINHDFETINLLSAGIDGIITNDPTLVLGLRRKNDTAGMARSGG